ncbi:MAG: hypothetical protein QM715_06910 [Nibricoccus sp.]
MKKAHGDSLSLARVESAQSEICPPENVHKKTELQFAAPLCAKTEAIQVVVDSVG